MAKCSTVSKAFLQSVDPMHSGKLHLLLYDLISSLQII